MTIDQRVLIFAAATVAPLHAHYGGVRVAGHVDLWNDFDVSSLGVLQYLFVVVHSVVARPA